MPTGTLDTIVLIAAGAVVVLVPMLIILLASRIRNAAHESTQAALTQGARQHDQALAEFTRQYDRSLAELTRQHERSMGEATRQHERALAELSAEHTRITQEFSMFSRKRHEVMARLYARYRRATHDLSAALTDAEPDFQKFTRDDLLRYLKRRDVRERDAADAIGAMDRGDIFAMRKLMSDLHRRVTLRDANIGFERAREYEALNELYLTEGVRVAVENVRAQVEALSHALTREQVRADEATRLAKQDKLHAAVMLMLQAMRDDLRSGGAAAARARPELDRPSARGALPLRAGLADQVAGRSAPT